MVENVEDYFGGIFPVMQTASTIKNVGQASWSFWNFWDRQQLASRPRDVCVWVTPTTPRYSGRNSISSFFAARTWLTLKSLNESSSRTARSMRMSRPSCSFCSIESNRNKRLRTKKSGQRKERQRTIIKKANKKPLVIEYQLFFCLTLQESQLFTPQVMPFPWLLAFSVRLRSA